MIETKCYVCGKIFRAESNYQFLCTDVCKERHEKNCQIRLLEQPFWHHSIELDRKRKCVICSQEFIAKVPMQITCSPSCSYKRQKEREKIWYQRKLRKRLSELEPIRNNLFKDISDEDFKLESEYRKLKTKLEGVSKVNE